MSDYDNFALVYDNFTDNVNYKLYTKHLLKLFEKYDKRPTLMLDLACGTGGFTFELAKHNIEVIGVDASEGMLGIAKQKQNPTDTNPLFLLQRAEELELFGTVDGAISMLDSLNHITDYYTLSSAIAKVSLFLEKDRLFIFDLNTEYKHREILGNNSFVREDENSICVWQNFYNENGVVDIYLDIFKTFDNINYKRITEEFSEKAYSLSEIKKVLTENSFELLNMLDDFTENPPNDKSERIIYIARKI